MAGLRICILHSIDHALEFVERQSSIEQSDDILFKDVSQSIREGDIGIIDLIPKFFGEFDEVALKRVARFKDLDERLNAECFLVGSLFSILCAVFVALAWRAYDAAWAWPLQPGWRRLET